MSQTVSTRVSACSQNETAGSRRHMERTGRIPKYVDRDRTHLNSLLMPCLPEFDLGVINTDRRSQRDMQRSLKSNSSLSVEGIITFGAAAQKIIDALSVAEQDALFREIAEKIADYLNTSLSGLAVHRDESAIHAHFQMPAYRMDGFPVAQAIGREKAKVLQDLAGACCAPYGITRGKPKADRIREAARDGQGNIQNWSKIIHKTVKELHGSLEPDLQAAREALEVTQTALQEQQARLEKNVRLAQKAETDMEAGRGEAEKVRKRLETYQRRAGDAQAQMAALEAQQQQHQERWASIQAQLAEVRKEVALLPSPEAQAVRVETISGGFMGHGRQVTEMRMVPEQAVKKYEQESRQAQKKVAQQAIDKTLEEARRREAEADARKAAYQASMADLDRLRDKLQKQGSALKHQAAVLAGQENRRQQQADRLATVMAELPEVHNAESSPITETIQDPEGFVAELLSHQVILRYGVLVWDYPERLVVPQQEVTPQQVAAALYRGSREKGWKQVTFNVQHPDTADAVYTMAKADGRLGAITIHCPGWESLEVKAITEALQAAHSFDNPYLVVQANRKRSLPMDLDRLDSGPNGVVFLRAEDLLEMMRTPKGQSWINERLEARGPLWRALTEVMSGAGHAQKDGAVAYPPASTEDEDGSSVPEFDPFG